MGYKAVKKKKKEWTAAANRLISQTKKKMKVNTKHYVLYYFIYLKFKDRQN